MRSECTTFQDHLEALRQALVRSLYFLGLGVFLAFCFAETMWSLLATLWKDMGLHLVALHPLEELLATCKLAFVLGLVVSSPAWLTEAFLFVNPALHREERVVVVPLLVLLFLFTAVGVLGALLWLLPTSVVWLSSFSLTFVEQSWSLEAFLDYVLLLVCMTCFVLQLLLGLFVLVYTRVIRYEPLARGQKVAWFFSFVLGAFLTPPDLVSQVVLGLFLGLSYQAAVGLAWLRS